MTPSTRHWHQYETLAGESLRYPPPSADVDDYLRRVRRAAYDPEIGEDALVELIYASENPLLDPAVFEKHGAVTRRVFANPLYHVMSDLLDRKRVQLGRLDPVAASMRHTMTVEEAALDLGVSRGLVVDAIRMRRLSTWKRDGVPMIDPGSLATFRRCARHRPRAPRNAALRVRLGNRPGVSFRVRAPDLEVVSQHKVGAGKVCEAVVPPFEQVAVRFRSEANHRFLVLEPGELESELQVDAFGVTGRFVIAEEIRDPAEAARRWKLFQPT